MQIGNDKRTEALPPEQVQAGNRAWWTENPMSYDWHGENGLPRFSPEWFAEIDRRFIFASRLFATDVTPFDRIIPFERLRGQRVLEIGCGMGLHTELMARAGAEVTAVDLSDTSIEATRRRLELAGLRADIRQADAENLPFEPGTFDFVWSWGVIHHSSRTARVVREIARVTRPQGECRAMVYNRDGANVGVAFVRDHLLSGAFLRRSFEETLYAHTDGFSARYYVREHFEDLFRGFFTEVSGEVLGQDADALPLPRRLRSLAMRIVPESYMVGAQKRRGSFIFVRARRPG